MRRYFPDGTLSLEQTREELAWVIDVYYRTYGYGLSVEVPYLLDKDYWGRGLAGGAARAIVHAIPRPAPHPG